MNRILSTFLATAFALSLTGVAGATSSMSNSMHGKHMAMKHGCARGQMWVKGYMREGKMVKGYCRASMKKM